MDKIFTLLYHENKHDLTDNQQVLNLLERDNSLTEAIALGWWDTVSSWFSTESQKVQDAVTGLFNSKDASKAAQDAAEDKVSSVEQALKDKFSEAEGQLTNSVKNP